MLFVFKYYCTVIYTNCEWGIDQGNTVVKILSNICMKYYDLQLLKRLFKILSQFYSNLKILQSTPLLLKGLASIPALSCRCMTYAHFNRDVS